jgi:hypothetical protein
MPLDILRFIEVKRDGKWTHLHVDNGENSFNMGKRISEYWLENEQYFHRGIPNDSDKNEEFYFKHGYSPVYITLKELDALVEKCEHDQHQKLKTERIFTELNERGILEVDKDFYPVYEYDNYEIETKFDDLYAEGLLRLNSLRGDYFSAIAIVDFIEGKCVRVPLENIRIIYLYNR